MHPRIHAQTRPDHPAVVMAASGETVTYRELEDAANRGAQLLRRLGLKVGDTIAVWMENSPRYFEIFWAAQRAGLYLAPVSTHLTSEEAGYIINDCGARVLVTSAQVKAASALIAARGGSSPAVEHIFSVGTALAGAENWGRATAAMPAHPIGDETAGYHLFYSSGTSGRPKGIRLPLAGGPAVAEHKHAPRHRAMFGVGPHTVYLCPAPLYHAAPLSFTTTEQSLGATVVVMDHFDPEGALAAIEKYRVTMAQMVPTMFVRILKLPPDVRARYDLRSLECVIHAAAPCPIPVKRQMIEWVGPIIAEYYSGSEGLGMTYITSEEWLRKPGSVGRAVWGALHVCDEAGRETPRGEPGLIYFSGATHFQYLNDPVRTQETRHPTNRDWATLGDIGYLDEDGYLFLKDRQAYMIITGGVNVYPQETENVLIAHPKVADAAVFGIPNEEMGEEVKAVVQPLSWSDAGPGLAEELIAYCRSRISAIKCPRTVDFEQTLPRTETGKLLKRILRARYVQSIPRG